MAVKTVGSYTIRTFDVPPSGFDPLQALPSTLLHHGFPRRPSEEKEPKTLARWKRAMTLYRDLRFTYITPELEEMPHQSHDPDSPAGTTADGSRASYNWSGTIVFVDHTKDKFQSVIGRWMVPNAYNPRPQSLANFYSAAWIGIDGANEGLNASVDLLQAGTVTEFKDGKFQCFAFSQWYNFKPLLLSNFKIAPGDLVSVAICVTDYLADPTPSAFCTFGNLTSRQYTSFAQSGATTAFPARPYIVGNCAQAIVERRTVLGILLDLPRFGEVLFDEVMAGTTNEVNYDLGNGTPITMINADGTPVAKAEIVDSDAIRVYYTGP